MNWFTTFGAMLDCSRNAVMTVKELKRFITLLSRMGYNQLQLYMEDTYEVDNEPFFGHCRGRYTQAELKEIDEFASGLGVELVPCIQTLAHLRTLIHWPEYESVVDIDDVLLIGDERTYELIEHMISSLRKSFRTHKIHIGMDEAYSVGKGKYRDLHGERDRSDILLEHLNRVCEITAQYDFEPMMWSDMFYRIASNGGNYDRNAKISEAVKKKIPADVSLVYWDYYHTDKATYTQLLRNHKQISEKVVFAGGAWKWHGFMPHNRFSMRILKASLTACMEEGVRDVFITMWGDNGADASAWSVLPALCYAACLAQGITKMDEIKKKFTEWVGYRFDDFMLLDLPNRLSNNSNSVAAFCKIFLYNDCFMGIFDNNVCDIDGAQYAQFARRLRSAAKRTGEYAYLFDTAAKLCSVLEYKAQIGVRTRAAYLAGDDALLDSIIADYAKTIKRTEAFYAAFCKQWHLENKPHGFDVHDIRLGGLLMRMKHCKARLEAYRANETDRIEELEQAVLPLYERGEEHNWWLDTVTHNLL